MDELRTQVHRLVDAAEPEDLENVLRIFKEIARDPKRKNQRLRAALHDVLSQEPDASG